jgi:hypothetical protein
MTFPFGACERGTKSLAQLGQGQPGVPFAIVDAERRQLHPRGLVLAGELEIAPKPIFQGFS